MSEAVESLKGLEWQVSLRQSDLYYMGRGNTPARALADLTQSLSKGIEHAEEQTASFKRRVEQLNAALEEAEAS